MTESITDSYDHCLRLARRSGRNFYFSFIMLPRPTFRAMCVLYAFMRETDDLADRNDVALDVRRQSLERWRHDLRNALAGELPQGPILPALVDVVRRYDIPDRYLFDVISGVESDLTQQRFIDFDDLFRYSYQVAGAVGLCCIHIWGFTDPKAREAAVACGVAFQLTNILRDLYEDAHNDRVYLPQADLDRFDYSADDLRAAAYNDAFRQLMQFQVRRAKHYYARAADLYEYLDRPGRSVYSAMLGIYGRLLKQIEACDFNVFAHPPRLSRPHKIAIAALSLCGRRHTYGVLMPDAAEQIEQRLAAVVADRSLPGDR